MIDLKSLIKRSIHRSKTNGKIKEALILSLFSQAIEKFFDNEINEKVKPLYFKEDKLTIASLSVSIVEGVKVKESQIIDYINENLNEDLVKKIKIDKITKNQPN